MFDFVVVAVVEWVFLVDAALPNVVLLAFYGARLLFFLSLKTNKNNFRRSDSVSDDLLFYLDPFLLSWRLTPHPMWVGIDFVHSFLV